MKRGTIFIVLFILVAAIVIGASQFLRSQPPLEILVAVDPLVEAWVQDAVTALNNTQPVVNATQRVQFRVTLIDDLDVWGTGRIWNEQSHPAAWIPSSSTSITYAGDNGYPLQMVVPSLVRTPLVWGGYASRIAVLTGGNNRAIDWGLVETAAKAESWQSLGGQEDWRFVKMALPQPGRKMSGLAALFTGAATFSSNPALDRAILSSGAFRDWMLPVINAVPNFATLGSDPAAAMARGPSTVEIGIFPESLWLVNLNGLLSNEEVYLSYPAYQFVLDFPLARWQDATTPPEQTQAVNLLGDWLSAAAQQARAPGYGLRPAAGEPSQTDSLFASAIPYGIQLTPNYGTPVQAPSRGDAQGLIQWVETSL